MTDVRFKNDRFKKRRGGYSRWFLISCEHCEAALFKYQKDGPGILKRLYLDRIDDQKFTAGKSLICRKCKHLLGTRMIFEKEKRPAFRLYVGAVEKKIIKT